VSIGPRPDRADPDAGLMAGVGAGDAAACGALLDRHLGRVLALAQRLLGDAAEAEDVGQEVFLRLWQQAADWRIGEAKLSTWIHQVTLNLCRDRLRRRRHGVDLEDVELLSTNPAPERVVETDQRGLRIGEALAELPERQREAIVLCHYQELGNIEAAALLDVSVEALESLLSRARRSLRVLLSAERESGATSGGRTP
jgi:RNA polymerase sigma factor (sigma-70 family)